MPVPYDEAAPSELPNHSAHPGHTLKWVADDDGRQLFICDGCKEPGAGARYRCEHERCDFDLHTCCAVAPATLTHPAFPDRVFLFLQEPEPPRTSTGKGGGRSCAAACCRKPVRGFVYHCFDDGIDLHPCTPSSKSNEQSRNAHRLLPFAIHRGLDRMQAGKRDPTPAENTQPMKTNNRVFDVRRQEVTRPGDASGCDRNRGQERALAASRHRWWTWKR